MLQFLNDWWCCGFLALVDTLVAKTKAWEQDHDMSFMYDGVSLLAMLDEYNMLRQDREEEKRKQRVCFGPFDIRQSSSLSMFRQNSWGPSFLDVYVFQDQKRFHEQLATEQEAMFGSRPSPVRPLGAKKVISPRSNGSAPNGTATRRLSLNSHQGGSSGSPSLSRDGKRDNSNRPSAPVNYVAIAKEDAASPVQVNASPWGLLTVSSLYLKYAVEIGWRWG